MEQISNNLDPKTLSNLQSMLIDIIAGDDTVLARPEYRTLNIESIKIALDFLLNNPMLDDKQKAYLTTNSWRINYRDKPPSVSEFITEKYLGRAATQTYSRVKQVFEEFMDPSKPYRNLVLYPCIGWGKASRLSARVYTPEGFKLMKDIQPGDRVSTPNGKTATVLQSFLQPMSMLYKVTLTDGRSTIVHKEHLWKVAKSWHNNKPCWKIMTTAELLESGNLKENRYFIPITEPVLHNERSHKIPPYTLGALLGDGSTSSSAIELCGDDKEIFDKVEAELPSGLYFKHAKLNEKSTVWYSVTIQPKIPYSKNVYKEELCRLNLMEKKAWEKFIPEEYLYDSVNNRLALLQGLMDTDGTASRDGYNTFYSTSLQLAKDVLQLVQSLGGYGRLQGDLEGRKDNLRPEYLVSVSFPDRAFPVFSLERKQKRCINNVMLSKARRKGKWLTISSIEPFAEEPSKCILLDDEDHLYLTDEYIVTHNSYLSTLINIYTGVHLSLMRNPYKFFGLNPASILSQLLISYSLKKSSELLLEPMIAILEASPFFEKVHTRDSMLKRDQDFERQSKIDKIYWTTAVPTSAIQFNNGANFKLVSNVQNLLGLTVVTGTMSELSFFRDAGKALTLDARIAMADGSEKLMRDIRIGDRLKHPYEGESEVIGIPYEGEDEAYEITLASGKTVICNAKHIWPVIYELDGVAVDENVTTQFMIDHPEIVFDILEEEELASLEYPPNRLFR